MTTNTAQSSSRHSRGSDHAERGAPAVNRRFNRQEAMAHLGIKRKAFDQHMRARITTLPIGNRHMRAQVDLDPHSRDGRPKGMLGRKPLAGALGQRP